MGHRAGDGVQPGRGGVESRHGAQQSLGVGMGELYILGKQSLGGYPLHHLAAVHDHDIVCHLVDNAQVMGDEHDGRAMLLLQRVHQVQNLSLNGHVQCGGGLVGNQQLGLAGQGHGDHDTLTHTAGELVRILLEHHLRVGNFHISQHLQGGLGSFLLAHTPMNPEGLTELPLHGENRVQAGHGLLKDHGDLVAPDVVHLLGADFGKILAVKGDGAAGNVAVGIQKPQNAHGGHAFAGSGLANDAQGLAGHNGIGNVVHGLHRAVSGFEESLEVLDLKQRSGVLSHYFSTSDLGSRMSRSVSPMMLMQITTMERNNAGNSHLHQ